MIIQGRAVPIDGSDVDTDRIVPARFLKELTFERMGDYLFHDVRFDEQGRPKEHPLNDTQFKGASIMLVGANFGCGSSREHAAQAVKRAGFKAVVGISFSEIFSGNCQSIGVPVMTASPESIQALSRFIHDHPSASLVIDLQSMTLTYELGTTTITMLASRRDAFLSQSWDGLALLESNHAKTQALADRLPYGPIQIRSTS